jgi:uncharacterized protein (DUF58 family)
MTALQHGAYVDLHTLLRLRYTAKNLQLKRQKINPSQLNGQFSSRYLNRGMEFEEVRAYQPGDDVRTIDWRVTARTQVTHTKCYREEREKPVFTLVDQRCSMFFGSHPCFKSVYACSLAALLNWAAVHGGDRTGGLVIGTDQYADVRPSRNHKNINRWLQQLVTFNHQLTTPIAANELTLADALRRLQRICKPGSSIFLISDYHDFNTECEHLLSRLSMHCQLNFIWVIDQLEMKLPATRQLAISDGTARLTVYPDRHFQRLSAVLSTDARNAINCCQQTESQLVTS